MNRENIEKLEELLAQKIGTTKKILSTKTSRLTAVGDNYGGLLLRLDITLEDLDGTTEDLHAVAKTIPINIFLQQIFDVQVTVRKEIAFYGTIVPLLRQFQEERGVEDLIDIFPEFYGARLNLNGSDVVDESSVILMENLVHAGYKNVNRLKGFDLETTKLILKDLAIFHSSFLALKVSKPDIFEAKVSPYLTRPKPPQHPPGDPEGKTPPSPDKVVKEFLLSCEEIRHLLPKMKELLEFPPQHNSSSDPRPFFTVAHNDLWVNNIMVKFENDKPVSMKLVDFQNLQLRSPVQDLFFFLMSSVEQSVLDRHLDEFVKYYHDMFIENLTRHKCDPTPYSFDLLLEEIRIAFKAALGQTMFMVFFVVLRGKGFVSEEDPSAIPDFGSADDITPQAKERVVFLLKKSDEKGWL